MSLYNKILADRYVKSAIKLLEEDGILIKKKFEYFCLLDFK